jgi:putative phosphoribosyl transferase
MRVLCRHRIETQVGVERSEGPVGRRPPHRDDDAALDHAGVPDLDHDAPGACERIRGQVAQPCAAVRDQDAPRLLEALLDREEVVNLGHSRTVRGRTRSRTGPKVTVAPMRRKSRPCSTPAPGAPRWGQMPFRDRREAGRRLADRLSGLQSSRPLVLGLPRGGVPVAFEVAQSLGAPLDILVVRKLGVPFQPELGMGAVGEDGVRVLNPAVLREAGVSDAQIAEVEARERGEVEERAERLRRGRPAVPLSGRTIIIIDDGLATGGTARAAIQVAKERGAARGVLAVPVAPPDTVAALAREADEVVALEMPEPFFAIGGWYADFTPTSDEEVVDLLTLSKADEEGGGDSEGARGAGEQVDDEVEIPAGRRSLAGHLTIPSGASGIVAFAHGSGSGRHSPRNQAVARTLNQTRLGTLLFDLLSPEEEADRANVFDIPLLGERLATAAAWLAGHPSRQGLPLGYFGASTGAAAALWAAADPDAPVAAIVSRGGRPDLAGARLEAVRVPTLLIVGGRDEAVLELNREAAQQLRCEHRIEIVPGATHLFEEPGALDTVSDLASRWFLEHLSPARS